MPSQRILICGAGVAGSITAFWLAKHDFEIVVIERARSDQKLGQGIEIEEPALQVVKMMDIMGELEQRRTGELGFELVNERGRSQARFDVGAFSPTGALEMMRGDLTDVLYKAADKHSNVTYHFQTVIKDLQQTDDKVTVALENRATKAIRTEEFDMVIGADGSKSRTRQLTMGSDEELQPYNKVGAYVAFFSIPKQDDDWPRSKACHYPERRLIWKRPVGPDSKVTSVYTMKLSDSIPELSEANASGDRQKQKEIIAKMFGGLGWEASRVTSQMMNATNFYSDELMQVKLKTWSKNRVVLVGDAAWAPTPFTGEGNQLAILGAWTLAQEIARHSGVEGFTTYEKRFRSYVEKAQQIPLGGKGPKLLLPETQFGIWVLHSFFYALSSFVQFLVWTNLASRLMGEEDKHEKFDLEASEKK